MHETVGMMDLNITHNISRKSDVKRYERPKALHDESSIGGGLEEIMTGEREVRQ